MAFDDVLRKYVGEVGRHQILVTLVLNILSIPGSFDVMEIIFSQATPPFWPKGELLCLKIWIHTRTRNVHVICIAVLSTYLVQNVGTCDIFIYVAAIQKIEYVRFASKWISHIFHDLVSYYYL